MVARGNFVVDINWNEGKLAKLYYATDAKGHYTKVNSIGWEPETVAMEQAWDVVHAEVEAARQKVIAGKASPVLYFLKKNTWLCFYTL